ncbi:MAG: preprotein translocase subunit SecE [Planctomycetota bacterium]|nr:preprotein translocase subunit SecE [Planctomycetota bacterium]
MLFRYKPDEGRNARQATFWLGEGMLAFACYALSGTLTGWVSMRRPLIESLETVPVLGVPFTGAFAIAAALFVVGSLVFVRYMSAEKQAQHLIEVEAEVNKVTWPTFKEASNSSIVVVITVVVLMGFLAIADLLLGKVFNIILWENLR